MAAWYFDSDSAVLPSISQAVAERDFLLIHIEARVLGRSPPDTWRPGTLKE
jgi:hypothetical protein